MIPPRIAPARTAAEISEVAARAGRADRVGLDVEANGLFAYRASLCVLQLAWAEEGGIAVAILDAIEAPIDPILSLLGPSGPIKVLHDLSFDARLLDEAGAPLGNVRDTSVAARLLGYPATGLSSMLSVALGVTIDKRFQQHDWSRRPLTDEQLVYLAGDVRHLLELDDHLAREAQAFDIAPEIEEECAYKLASARAEQGRAHVPAYARIKGAKDLDAPGRAVLRRLVEARDRAAEAADVPPFKVVGNDVLLEIARARPITREALHAIRGASAGRAASVTLAMIEAVKAGILDGDIPPEDVPHLDKPRLDRDPEGRKLIAARRAAETRITGFRRAEAKRRGVDEQVVLPGHCAQDLADILAAHAPTDPALKEAIARIPGLGARRLERYGEVFRSLAQGSA